MKSITATAGRVADSQPLTPVLLGSLEGRREHLKALIYLRVGVISLASPRSFHCKEKSRKNCCFERICQSGGRLRELLITTLWKEILLNGAGC